MELREQYSARILIIGNEAELLSSDYADEYRKSREKAIWLDLSWATPPESAFEGFLSSDVRSEVHESVLSFKEEIFSAFRASKHSNLRTLQKVMRSLEFIQNEYGAELDPPQVRLLVSFIIRHAEGKLHEDRTAYLPYSHIRAKKNSDASKHTYVDREAIEFHETFFPDDYVQTFSDALYSYVESGLFDRIKFLEENGSEDANLDAGQRLFVKIQRFNFYFLPDEAVVTLIQEIETFLRSTARSLFSAVLRIYGELCRMSEHINVSIPNLTDALARRMREQVDAGERLCPNHLMRGSDEESAYIKPVVAQYEICVERSSAEKLKCKMFSEIASGHIVDLTSVDVRSEPSLMQILCDCKIWDEIDLGFVSQGEQHFRFYQHAARRVVESQLGVDEKRRRIETMKSRLIALSSKGDSSSRTRLEWLSKDLKGSILSRLP